MWTNVLSKMAFFIGGLCTMGGLHAQYLRTSYFIEGTSARLQLNPALQPMRGYVNVPILNAFMGASSNVLGLTDIIDVLDSGRDLFPMMIYITDWMRIIGLMSGLIRIFFLLGGIKVADFGMLMSDYVRMYLLLFLKVCSSILKMYQNIHRV